MADVMRYRHGDSEPREANCEDGTTIEIGDSCYLHGAEGGNKELMPADQVSSAMNLADKQEWFADRFAGVATQKHRASHDPLDDTIIRIGTAGVWEFICPTTALELGDLVAINGGAFGVALDNQGVIYVPKDQRELSIGTVARRKAAGVLTCLVEIKPTAVGDQPQTTSGSSSSV